MAFSLAFREEDCQSRPGLAAFAAYHLGLTSQQARRDELQALAIDCKNKDRSCGQQASLVAQTGPSLRGRRTMTMQTSVTSFAAACALPAQRCSPWPHCEQKQQTPAPKSKSWRRQGRKPEFAAKYAKADFEKATGITRRLRHGRARRPDPARKRGVRRQHRPVRRHLHRRPGQALGRSRPLDGHEQVPDRSRHCEADAAHAAPGDDG